MIGTHGMAHQFCMGFADASDLAGCGQGHPVPGYGDRTAAAAMGGGGGGGQRPLETAAGPSQQAAPPPAYYGMPHNYDYTALGMYGYPPMGTLPPPPAPLGPPAAPSAAPPGGGLLLPPLPPHPMLRPAGAPAPEQHRHHHAAVPAQRPVGMACMACRHSKLRCTKERPSCKR